MNISKSKIQRLAKLLNRILLLEGLEHVAGERMEVNIETPVTYNNWWAWVFIVFLLVVGTLILCIKSSGRSLREWRQGFKAR